MSGEDLVISNATDGSVVKRLRSIKLACDKNWCIHCLKPLSQKISERTNMYKSYCSNCDIWEPNNDSDVVNKIFNILDSNRIATSLNNIYADLIILGTFDLEVIGKKDNHYQNTLDNLIKYVDVLKRQLIHNES